jgi:hypothetical protein
MLWLRCPAAVRARCIGETMTMTTSARHCGRLPRRGLGGVRQPVTQRGLRARGCCADRTLRSSARDDPSVLVTGLGSRRCARREALAINPPGRSHRRKRGAANADFALDGWSRDAMRELDRVLDSGWFVTLALVERRSAHSPRLLPGVDWPWPCSPMGEPNSTSRNAVRPTERPVAFVPSSWVLVVGPASRRGAT